jgi:putative MFS transporter
MAVAEIATVEEAVTEKDIIARLERLPTSSWHVRMRAIVASATFFDAFDSISIAFVAPALIGLWHLRPTDIGLLISAGYVGSALGSFAFGWAAERYGRIRILTWTVVLFSLMSLASAGAWDFSSLAVLRFLTGLGVGGELYVALTYINEFAKAERRGWFVLIFQAIYAVGILAVSFLSVWIVPHFGWQWMFVIGAIPALFAFTYRRLLPESPRWLVSRGRLSEADTVLTRIEEEIAPDGKLPPVDTSKVPTIVQTTASWRDLFSGVYLTRTLTLWAVMFLATFVGWGVTLWLPSIYKSVFKLPDQQALFLSVISNVMIIVASLVCASVIDRIGRRAWMSICFAMTSIPLFAVFALGSNLTVTSMLVLATVASFFFPQIQLALGLYPTELYPTRIRALGSGVAAAWSRVGSVTGPLIIGFVLQEAGLSTDFLMLAGLAVLGFIVLAVFGVETRRRLLEEVSP